MKLIAPTEHVDSHWRDASATRPFSVAAAAFLVLLIISAVVSGAALGDDFRVENEVFLGGGKELVSRSTTLFHDGMVYDYLNEPAEVVVLDHTAGRFFLLDQTRQLRSELTVGEVTVFADRLQKAASQQKDALLRFLATPKFDEQFDPHTGRLTLSSPWMIYRVRVDRPSSSEIVTEYRDFSDWYARLNAMLHTGAKPPSARLLVNEALMRHGVLPREVQLTLRPKGKPSAKEVTILSRHRLSEPLTPDDLKQIAQAQRLMQELPSVSFAQYRQQQ